MKNQRGLALDKWWDAVPDDPYDLCPCGCGKKFRFVVKEGNEELEKHFLNFEKKIVSLGKAASNQTPN